MTTPLDYPPIPGAWVRRAQDALDVLSTMVTVDEVVAEFGTARALVEAVLGSPGVGGFGTKPVIRATGRLLTHRLGPALAAEALSWAASIAEVLNVAEIERFVETAAESAVVRRPVRLDNRHRLIEHLAGCRSSSQRRSTIHGLWRDRDLSLPLPILEPERFDSWDLLFWDLLFPGGGTDLPCWIEDGGVVHWIDPAWRHHQAHADDEVTQHAALELLESAAIARIAADPRLFDLAEPIVARCLLDHTSAVLANPACPRELRERVRHPYDAATLELAVRAGVTHFESTRVRRLLDALDTTEHQRYMAHLPSDYLRARRDCGLNSLDALSAGRLEGLDLSDREVARAAVGICDDWDARLIPDNVVDVLIHHPQAPDLAWILAEHRPIVPGEVALRLARQAVPQIAQVVLGRFVPPEWLEAQDAPLAVACGDAWIARCPGIPAHARPAMCVPSVHMWRLHWDDEAEGTLFATSSCHRFEYPEAVEALTGFFSEAPGWRVWLPASSAELWENARVMRNCTGSFERDIVEGRTFIVIIDSPEGERFNAAVHRTGVEPNHRYGTGQINSWANEGYSPEWIRPAFNARLADALRAAELTEPPERPRTTDRRRRKRRAQAVRRVPHRVS